MAVTMYGSPCESTRKTKEWFREHEIPFVERNIYNNPLTVQELRKILELTVEGTDEIIAKRSNLFKELKLDIDSLTLDELLGIIQQHPGLLRNPIVIDGQRLMVGYNESEIRKFLPRKVRKRQWLKLKMDPLAFAKG